MIRRDGGARTRPPSNLPSNAAKISTRHVGPGSNPGEKRASLLWATCEYHVDPFLFQELPGSASGFCAKVRLPGKAE